MAPSLPSIWSKWAWLPPFGLLLVLGTEMGFERHFEIQWRTPLSPQLFLPKPQFGLNGQHDPFSTLGGQDFCENTLEPLASFIRQIWKEEAFTGTTLNDKEDYYSGSSQTFNMSLLKRLTIPK